MVPVRSDEWVGGDEVPAAADRLMSLDDGRKLVGHSDHKW